MNRTSHVEYQKIIARVVPGHGVASGKNGDARFPGGTLSMQMPHFAARGLDLTDLYPGTLNVSVAPRRFRVVKPRHTFHKVQWHPVEPAEDFSFFDVEVLGVGNTTVSGFIYYPHPETKPEHFQNPDVIELWLPFIPTLEYGSQIELRVPVAQMSFEPAPPLETKPSS